MRFSSRLTLLLLPLAFATGALAQGAPEAGEPGPGLQFNGLGRTYIQQSGLGGALAGSDTVTAKTLTDGEFVLDLAVNAQPNRSTEIQGVIRLRNEFGGFFGTGATVEIRELWARGVIADAIRYRVGDMDLALTPYTVFLSDPDGTVNEPEVFQAQRERIDYEAFYTGRNERRFQGGSVDFGLAFDRYLDAVDARAFVARLRATDFRTVPTRLIGGGRVGATTAAVGPFASQATLGGNLSYVWDDLESGDANRGIRNAVFTFDTDVTLLRRPAYALHLVGEAGRSTVDLRERLENPPEDDAPLIDESDTFVELGLAADFRTRGVNVSAMLVDVGPDFYSSAAQSKRVDYTRSLESYRRIGNDSDVRPTTLFDLSRDAGIYTFRVANALMAYDPRYSNVLPYGRATPNRRGVRLGATYAPEEGPVEAALDVALLREIRGQGTPLLKDFVLVRASADVPVHRFAPLPRPLTLTFGAQFENTSRGGDPIETVDLASTLIEAGVTAEVYDRLDILLGATMRASSGRDYVPQIVNFNDVRDFPGAFITDDQEALLGAGLRYRFKDGVYFTVQAQRFSYRNDATPDNDYRIGQVFALYSMSF
jgi:hypothetical protein